MDITDRDLRDFKSLATPPRPRISESEFINRYLGLFVNQAEDNPLAAWLRVAISPFNEVDVFGEDGEVIYSVPPLCNKPDFKRDRGAMLNVGEIIANTEAKTKLSPVLGKRYWDTTMGSIIQEQSIDVAIALRWNAIFSRYGLTQIDIPISKIKNIDNKPKENFSASEFEDI